jgi:hypothetical protein
MWQDGERTVDLFNLTDTTMEAKRLPTIHQHFTLCFGCNVLMAVTVKGTDLPPASADVFLDKLLDRGDGAGMFLRNAGISSNYYSKPL